MNLYLILYCYNCTATSFSSHFGNLKVESNDGSHLESIDALGPETRIFKKQVHTFDDGQTVTNYRAKFSPNFNKYFV